MSGKSGKESGGSNGHNNGGQGYGGGNNGYMLMTDGKQDLSYGSKNNGGGTSNNNYNYNNGGNNGNGYKNYGSNGNGNGYGGGGNRDGKNGGNSYNNGYGNDNGYNGGGNGYNGGGGYNGNNNDGGNYASATNQGTRQMDNNSGGQYPEQVDPQPIDQYTTSQEEIKPGEYVTVKGNPSQMESTGAEKVIVLMKNEAATLTPVMGTSMTTLGTPMNPLPALPQMASLTAPVFDSCVVPVNVCNSNNMIGGYGMSGSMYGSGTFTPTNPSYTPITSNMMYG